jgi:hypothetical protein
LTIGELSATRSLEEKAAEMEALLK